MKMLIVGIGLAFASFSALAETAPTCPSARKFLVDPSGKRTAKDSETVISFDALPALLPGDDIHFVSAVHSLTLLSKGKVSRFTGLTPWKFAPIPAGTDESLLKACPIRFTGDGSVTSTLTQKLPNFSWVSVASPSNQTIYRTSLLKVIDPSVLLRDPQGVLLTLKKATQNSVTGIHFRGYYVTKSNVRIQYIPYQTNEEFTADSKSVFSWGKIKEYVVQASDQPVYAGPGLLFRAWDCAQALTADPIAAQPGTDLACSLYLRTDSTTRQHALGYDADQPDPTKRAPLIYSSLSTDFGTQQRDLPRLEFKDLRFVGVHEMRFWGGLPAGALFKNVQFEVSSGPNFSAARKMSDIRFENILFTQDMPPFIHYSDMKNTSVGKIPLLNACAGRADPVANPATEGDVWAIAGRKEPRELITCEPGPAGLFMSHGLTFWIPANCSGTISNIQVINSQFSRTVVPLGLFSSTNAGDTASYSSDHLIQGNVFQFNWDEEISIGAGVAHLTIRGNRFLDSMLGLNTVPSQWKGESGDFRVAILENTFDLRHSENAQPDGSFEPKPAYRPAGYPLFKPVDFKLPANLAVNVGAVDGGGGPMSCVHGSDGTCGGISFYHNTVIIRKGSDEESKPNIALTRNISPDASGFWNNLIVQMNPGAPAVAGGAYLASEQKISVSVNGNLYRLIGNPRKQTPVSINAAELVPDGSTIRWCSRFAQATVGAANVSINWGTGASKEACQKLAGLDESSGKCNSTDSCSKVEIFSEMKNGSSYILSLPPAGSAPVIIPASLPAPSQHRFGSGTY